MPLSSVLEHLGLGSTGEIDERADGGAGGGRLLRLASVTTPETPSGARDDDADAAVQGGDNTNDGDRRAADLDGRIAEENRRCAQARKARRAGAGLAATLIGAAPTDEPAGEPAGEPTSTDLGTGLSASQRRRLARKLQRERQRARLEELRRREDSERFRKETELGFLRVDAPNLPQVSEEPCAAVVEREKSKARRRRAKATKRNQRHDRQTAMAWNVAELFGLAD